MFCVNPPASGNVEARMDTAVKAADQLLVDQGMEPIGKATPHSLRRLYASLRYARGDDPIYVAEQGGWSDPAFPMRYYAKATRRRGKLTGAHLAAFDKALEWAEVSSGSVREPDSAATLTESGATRTTEETAA